MEKTTDTTEENIQEAGATPVTAEETRDPLHELEEKYGELNDRYLRLAAEFENYKKRATRETENTVRYANERFAKDMLDVLDNFERGLNAEDASLRSGLEQIHKLYLSVLERHGVKPMNAEGCSFDPNLHEAVAHIPSDEPEGTVVDEAIRGYMLHDRVLRHAKVAVSNGKQ
jgi:molecular chaperone GrpE